VVVLKEELLAKSNAAIRTLFNTFAAFFAVQHVGNLWLLIELLVDTISTHFDAVATA
jgi:uncharacterized protein YpbB